MSQILVTGSAGFIGFSLSKKLLELGHDVIGMDNFSTYYDPKIKRDRNKILLSFKKYSFSEGNITNLSFLSELFKKNKIDKICHLAAQVGVRYSITNPFTYEETNIKGFLNILESARKFKVKNIVYASSSSIYGNDQMPKNGFCENMTSCNPISFYGVTKRTDELIAYTYHNLYNINFTGLRFFTVYGPWGRPDMAYFKFTQAILAGKPIDVHNYGNMKRDFTFIDDIITGVVQALNYPFSHEIMNLGNSNPVSLKYFIKIIEDELGVKAKLNFLPMQHGEALETFANIENARNKLEFKPKVNIEEGLRLFIDWYKIYFNVT